MGKALLAVSALTIGTAACGAWADTVVVNGFGSNGWSSWETRASNGTLWIGSADSSAAAATYFKTPANSTSDTGIQKQILFMEEGQTVKSVSNATLPGAPSGSLNGMGYVRLDGTNATAGKSDLSYVDMQGIAAASALNDSDFTMTYRYYVQPYTSLLAALGLNFGIIGTDGNVYTFSYFQPGITSGWNSASVSSSSGLFSVSEKGAGSLGNSRTIQDWASNSTYGSTLFGTGAEIFRVGFNLGNSQPNVVDYLDYAQTNILSSGALIDFQAPSTSGSGSVTPDAAPLPPAVGMGMGAIGIALAATLFRRVKTRAITE